ncbi:uncharacterized protein LOC111641611 isoform X2 [Centruroides sculpturatus]|nr:uncharacterized protein LOC111641611 isoform X2 [Centruroides sculpturatus]XP_023243576.1 uncharacterized protein LOC111641611 isoform X2 [Centruroides sculpturatus]XP_023243577.1 uncharacterized protein LOC111641611 isoform X2 [Centruroides sculpturatus]
MRSFLWEGKRNDFPLKDYFVELTVEKADLFGKESGDNISLKEIFSTEEDGHQTILVTGDPGYGKSTLCKKIVYDWASANYLRHFHLTFIVILRQLNDRSVKDALLNEAHGHSSMNNDWKFRNKEMNILVILDGFDEIVEKRKILKFIREESFDISSRMTIVVTSRPQAAEDIREDMMMRFSIKGFTPEYQKKYVQLMFIEDENKANQLSSLLTQNHFYREIAECPLMLHMLCCLHYSGEIENLETITDLYVRIFSLITERYVRKTDQKGKFKKGKYFVGEILLVKLGQLHKIGRSIESVDLEGYFKNKEEFKFIIGLDILTLESFYEDDNITVYSFVNRTFGEFLSAFSAYTGCLSFSYITYTIEFLFLLGFYKYDLFPKRFLRALEKKIFTPEFMLQVHKQIKLKRNWEKFCSHSDVYCFPSNFSHFHQLLTLYQFKRLYIYFTDTAIEYDEVDEITHRLSICKCPNNFRIYIILSVDDECLITQCDIRESVSRIIYFCQKTNAMSFDIFFIGVKFYYCDSYKIFKDVNCNLDLSDDKRKLLKHEKLVALETGDDYESTGNLFISLEQYEYLRDRIKLGSTSKQNSKCVMM